MSTAKIIFGFVFLLALASTHAGGPAMGWLEGQLKIVALKQVELAHGGAAEKFTAENCAEYPLAVRSRDGDKEIARIAAGPDGHYRAKLPAGDYILDLAKRQRNHARAVPQPFTVLPNQTVRVDFEVDPGVR